MKMFSIKNIGVSGLNTDLAPWELDSGHLTYAANFRSAGNAVKSGGNYLAWATPGTDFNAGNLIHVGELANGYWMVMGRSAVYVYNGTWYDISNAAGYAGISADDELLWTACKLGRIPIINNPQHYPEYWSPQSTGQVMQYLNFDAGNTWASLGYTCKVMRSHKDYLFALNLTEGATELPNSYRWSHPAVINGLPFSWDETDTSSLAGKSQLGGDSGDLIDGLSLRDSFCLYAEKGIHILDPSNDESVWNRRQLSSTVGLISSNTVAQVNNIHFLLVDGDFISNDGNNIVSIAHNRIRTRLLSNLNETYYNRSYTINNRALKELWFCVPEGDATYPNMAYIYNWRDDKWGVIDLPSNTAFAAYGPKTIVTDTWSNIVGTWATTLLKWTGQSITPLNDSIISISTSNSGLVEIDPEAGTGTANTGCRLERTNLVIGDITKTKTVTRAYPKMNSTSPVTVQIGSQQTPDGAVEWETAVTFTPGTDRKVDCRSTGFLHAWRIDSVAGGNVNCSGIDFEYEDAGER